MQEALKAGWDYSSKQMGSDFAAHLGNEYIANVDDAVQKLVEQAGGIVVGKMAILAEGAAQKRDDIIYLEKLPLFNSDGSIKE